MISYIIIILLISIVSSAKLPAASIIIENKMEDTLYLYSSPKAYFIHGNLVKSILPHTLDTFESKNWVRLRSNAFEKMYDIFIGKFSKKVMVRSKDSIIISNLLNNEILNRSDSIIYLRNETYLINELENDLCKAKDFKDSIASFLEYGELIPPKIIDNYLKPIMKQLSFSDILIDSNISINIREYIVYSITTYLIAYCTKEREIIIRNMIDKVQKKSPELYQLCSKNKSFKYIMENIDFYDRVTDFLEKLEIKLDTSKINIIYFTSSWCQYCIQDFKRISEGEYNMENVDLYIIGLEDDEKGEIRLMSLLKDISIDYKLRILRGGTNSIYNERLGVQAVPQIYLYDKKENSEQIGVILSYYLENLIHEQK